MVNGLISFSVRWRTFPYVGVRTVRRRFLCMHKRSSTFANELSIRRGFGHKAQCERFVRRRIRLLFAERSQRVRTARGAFVDRSFLIRWCSLVGRCSYVMNTFEDRSKFAFRALCQASMITIIGFFRKWLSIHPRFLQFVTNVQSIRYSVKAPFKAKF